MFIFYLIFIKEEYIVKLKLFGFLIFMMIRKEENGYKIKIRYILDEFEVINIFNIGY